MVIRSIIPLALLALMSNAAAQSPEAFNVSEMAAQMESIRNNAHDIVGEETMQSIPEVHSRAQGQYAEDLKVIQSHNQALFEQGVGIAKEMAGSQWDHAEKSEWLPSEAPGDRNGDIPTRYRIFVSQRMPDAEIKGLIDTYRERLDVSIVLRGMLPGQTITGVHSWMGRLLKPITVDSILPNITMDPEPFTELGVDQVPVIARYDDEGELMAYALGITSAAWIDERVGQGARGNLGAFGPTIVVGEEDIIQVMMKKAEAFDWKGAASGAVDRFWLRTEAHSLPTVVKARRLVLDPTFEVSQDIKVPDGTVIARAGDRINPLDMAPFTALLVFFNPAETAQVQWATAVVAANPHRSPILMASQLRTLDGLDALGELSDQMGARIFALPKDVISRFQLERVPSLVWAEGQNFIIEEQLPSERPKER